MTPFEYLLPLISVLVGLSIADLAVSLHRLLRARRRVRWDWLPLATALLAVLAVLEVWWTFYDTQHETFYRTLGVFLSIAAQLILLFLLNAAALPDEVPAEGLDLRVFYDTNGPYFWSLYAGYVGLIMVARIVTYATYGLPDGMGVVGVATRFIPNLVLLALFVVLVRVRRRALHAVIVVGLIVLLLSEWWGLSL